MAASFAALAHQPAGNDLITGPISRRNPVARRQADYLHVAAGEEWAPSDEEGIEALALKGGEGKFFEPLMRLSHGGVRDQIG